MSIHAQKGLKIRLSYFERDDFKQLMEWINTDSLLKHWAGDLFSFPLTEKSMEWYLNETNEIGISDAFVYKAIDESTGRTVGHISLGGLSYKNSSARISRVFVAETGKGICQLMVNAVLKIGFEDMKLHRISLGVYDDNPGAVKCYQKSGFKIEGLNRDIMRYENEWWSMIEMGILEHEWREITNHTS